MSPPNAARSAPPMCNGTPAIRVSVQRRRARKLPRQATGRDRSPARSRRIRSRAPDRVRMCEASVPGMAARQGDVRGYTDAAYRGSGQKVDRAVAGGGTGDGARPGAGRASSPAGQKAAPRADAAAASPGAAASEPRGAKVGAAGSQVGVAKPAVVQPAGGAQDNAGPSGAEPQRPGVPSPGGSQRDGPAAASPAGPAARNVTSPPKQPGAPATLAGGDVGTAAREALRSSAAGVPGKTSPVADVGLARIVIGRCGCDRGPARRGADRWRRQTCRPCGAGQSGCRQRGQRAGRCGCAERIVEIAGDCAALAPGPRRHGSRAGRAIRRGEFVSRSQLRAGGSRSRARWSRHSWRLCTGRGASRRKLRTPGGDCRSGARSGRCVAQGSFDPWCNHGARSRRAGRRHAGRGTRWRDGGHGFERRTRQWWSHRRRRRTVGARSSDRGARAATAFRIGSGGQRDFGGDGPGPAGTSPAGVAAKSGTQTAAANAGNANAARPAGSNDNATSSDAKQGAAGNGAAARRNGASPSAAANAPAASTGPAVSPSSAARAGTRDASSTSSASSAQTAAPGQQSSAAAATSSSPAAPAVAMAGGPVASESRAATSTASPGASPSNADAPRAANATASRASASTASPSGAAASSTSMPSPSTSGSPSSASSGSPSPPVSPSAAPPSRVNLFAKLDFPTLSQTLALPPPPPTPPSSPAAVRSTPAPAPPPSPAIAAAPAGAPTGACCGARHSRVTTGAGTVCCDRSSRKRAKACCVAARGCKGRAAATGRGSAPDRNTAR